MPSAKVQQKDPTFELIECGVSGPECVSRDLCGPEIFVGYLTWNHFEATGPLQERSRYRSGRRYTAQGKSRS